MLYTLENKRVLVVGMVRSGIAATRLLAAKGAIPLCNDLKTREELKGLEQLEGIPCEYHLGEDPDSLLSRCDLVVLSPGVPIQSPWIARAKDLGLTVIGELELGAAFAQGPQLAISGTNGKTTTTSLLGEIVKNAGNPAHVVGNIGAPITAAALDACPGDMYVIEVSSFQMETARAFHPHVAAILNISPDHLNRHGDMETYMAMKARMFQHQGPEDVAVYNGDDPLCCRMMETVRATKLAFSRRGPVKQGAYVRDGKIILVNGEEEYSLCGTEELGIPGNHNLENALAAVCMAAVMKVPGPVIRQTLASFKGVPHRLELIRTLDGVAYINDSKGTNVDSTLRAIEAMGKPTVIILGGDDKGVSFGELARSVSAHPMIRQAVLIGKTAAAIEEALGQEGFTSVHHGGFDFEKALAQASSLCRPGWNVLLSPACASFDMFRDYEHRGEEFRRIVTAMGENQ